MHPDMCFSAKDFKVYIDDKEIGLAPGGFIPTVESIKDVEFEVGEMLMPMSKFDISIPFQLPIRSLVAWYLIMGYPNRRVAHLAMHGHTERVRKKNLKRMQQWRSR